MDAIAEPEPDSETQIAQATERSARIFSCAAKAWGTRSTELGLCTPTVELIDVRKTLKHANPHHDATLQPKTGLEAAVVDYIVGKARAEFESLVSQVMETVQSGRSVCVVCVGGKHRSVAIAEQAACRLGLQAEHLMLLE